MVKSESISYLNLEEISQQLSIDPTKPIELSKHVREVSVDTYDPRGMSLTFSTDYFIANSNAAVEDKGRFCFFWKSLNTSDNSQHLGVLRLDENSELFDEDWNGISYFVKRNVVYFSLSKIGYRRGEAGDIHKIGLASFRIEPDGKTLTRLSGRVVEIDQGQVSMLPSCLDERFCPDVRDFFLIIKRRVFVVSECSRSVRCFKIHCFYKSQVLPIGGTNMGSAGTYHLGPGMDLFTGTVGSMHSGYFNLKWSAANEPKKDELTVSRFIIS